MHFGLLWGHRHHYPPKPWKKPHSINPKPQRMGKPQLSPILLDTKLFTWFHRWKAKLKLHTFRSITPIHTHWYKISLLTQRTQNKQCYVGSRLWQSCFPFWPNSSQIVLYTCTNSHNMTWPFNQNWILQSSSSDSYTPALSHAMIDKPSMLSVYLPSCSCTLVSYTHQFQLVNCKTRLVPQG